MSKSVFVIDTPNNCIECPFYKEEDYQCPYINDPEKTIRHSGCPLKPMPQRCGSKRKEDEVSRLIALGWNACIDYLEEE